MKRLVFVVALCMPSAAMAQDAKDIVAKIEMSLAPKNVRASYQFTNTRTDGTVTTYEVRFDIRDADHSVGSFQKPEREKGREILRLGDDIWSFVPGVGRVVRIADRDSFAGGDFSNADVLRADWLAKYDAKILKDLPNQWIIEMVAKTPEAPYGKMRLWVDKKSGQPVQQTFHDARGTELKRCAYGDIKKYGTIERPARLRMENVVTKQKSELIVLDLTTVPGFPDTRFVVDSLGK